MDWLLALFRESSIAHALLSLALTLSFGFILGNIRVAGISLGVGGVLFAGLILGHFQLAFDPALMEFVKDFGLVLFVYSIGLQVGPGFVSSLRRQGFALNLFAVIVVILGTIVTSLIAIFSKIDFPVVMGLLAGAVTSTPSLGAIQQALRDIPTATVEGANQVGMGYAVAYPFGILGIILVMLLVRKLFAIDVAKEAEEFEKLQQMNAKPITTRDFEVTNPNLAGRTVGDLLALLGPGVVVTRVYRQGVQHLATPDLSLALGDVIHVIGTQSRLDPLHVIIGCESRLNISSLPSRIIFRRVLVTNKAVVGKALEDLDLDDKYGVIVSRVIRSGVEFTATRGFRVEFGDRLMIVGDEQTIEKAALELGNSLRDLDQPNILPIFVGIALGVIVGSWPILLPGMPAPVRLGMAGGPLLVAILIGRLGKIGPVISYMPTAAKSLLREFGIALFLGCTGLAAGGQFFKLLASGRGFYWMALAALITFIPLLIVAVIARGWKKLNYLSLCGLLSGSMTDTAALAYATQMTKNDAPSMSYATVYPFTMILRVVIAQAAILLVM